MNEAAIKENYAVKKDEEIFSKVFSFILLFNYS